MNRYTVCGVALLASALSYAPVVNAQAPVAPAARNSLGQPNLEGLWVNSTITPPARPAVLGNQGVFSDAEAAQIEGTALANAERGDKPTDPNEGAPAGGRGVDVGAYNRAWMDPGLALMRVRGEARTSIINTADGLPPAPKTGAAISEAGRAEIKRVRESTAPLRLGPLVAEDGNMLGSPDVDQHTENPEERGLGERCVLFGRTGGPPMLPGAYNNNTRIVQSPDHVMINVEMVHDSRIVRLNDRKHISSNIRPHYGDSVGWYEGNTLVVETTNIPKVQAYYGSWENLKVTERFSRTSDNRLAYSFTIEDPTIWDKPWGGEYEFAPLQGEMYEYACHEGNYSMANILAGSRAEDATRDPKSRSSRAQR